MQFDALAIGGSLSVAASKDEQNYGDHVAVAVAGGFSFNTVEQTIEASIRNSSDVTANSSGNVTVHAGENYGLFRADAFGAALSYASTKSNSDSTAVAVGICIAINDRTNTIKATIDNSYVTAAGDVEVSSRVGSLSSGIGSFRSFLSGLSARTNSSSWMVMIAFRRGK